MLEERRSMRPHMSLMETITRIQLFGEGSEGHNKSVR